MGAPLQPGATTRGPRGTYQVLRALGSGGFADTYLARQKQGAREVVLKVLRLERAERWKTVELFEREARVLRQLEHPNIPVYVDDFPLPEGDRSTGFALVQTFVPGPTLREVLQREERPAQAAWQGWLRTLLEVCRYLHAQSPPVIHRDINPGNVVLREPDGQAVLIDFGIVQAALRSASTVSSTAAGTFGYAPLEQFVGRATPASDLYSVAVTMLAVVSGLEPDRMPFARNRIQVAETLHDVAVDARLTLLLEEMTEPDAARRPQSALEVLERLQAIGAPAPRPSPPPRAASLADDTLATRIAAVERRWRETAARAARVPKGWELPDYPELADIAGFALAPEGRFGWLTLGRLHGGAVILDTERLRISPAVEEPPHGLGPSLSLSGDGLTVIASDFSGSRALVLGADGQVQETPLEMEGDGSFWMKGDHLSLAVSADRRRLALLLTFGSAAGGYLFDLGTGKVLQRFGVPPGMHSTFGNRALLFSPDQRALVAIPRSGSAQVMDAGGEWRELAAKAVAFSQDGRNLALLEDGSNNLLAGEWENLAPLRWRGAPRRLWQSEDRAVHLRFSPDGSRVALACDGGRALVLDAESGRILLDALEPHRPGQRWKSIDALGFSADGERLFVHGRCARYPSDTERDDAVGVYAISSGRALGTLMREKNEGVRLLGVTPQGFYGVISRGGDKGRGLHRPALVSAALRGEPWEEKLEEAERDAAADLEARLSFWTRLAGLGRVPEGKAIAELVAAGQGIAHLSPRAVELASGGAVENPRLGEGVGGTSLSVPRLVAALHDLAGRSAAEREVIFEDMLTRVLGEETDLAQAEQRRGRAERRRLVWAGTRRWLFYAAVALFGAAVFLLWWFKRR